MKQYCDFFMALHLLIVYALRLLTIATGSWRKKNHMIFSSVAMMRHCWSRILIDKRKFLCPPHYGVNGRSSKKGIEKYL